MTQKTILREVVKSFNDPRICIYVMLEIHGSAARNTVHSVLLGKVYCFS